jgi:hypothetical protein
MLRLDQLMLVRLVYFLVRLAMVRIVMVRLDYVYVRSGWLG